MNHDLELRLQAWVDGELPPAEAAATADLVRSNPAARALADELRNTNSALAGNELDRPLPESREFFWSKIEREIQRGEATTTHPQQALRLRWAWRLLAPIGFTAALALVVVLPLHRSQRLAIANSHTEIESGADDISFFTFRSEAEGMTVVWVACE